MKKVFGAFIVIFIVFFIFYRNTIILFFMAILGFSDNSDYCKKLNFHEYRNYKFAFVNSHILNDKYQEHTICFNDWNNNSHIDVQNLSDFICHYLKTHASQNSSNLNLPIALVHIVTKKYNPETDNSDEATIAFVQIDKNSKQISEIRTYVKGFKEKKIYSRPSMNFTHCDVN